MQKGDLRREFTVHVMIPDPISADIDQLTDETAYPDWDWKDADDRHITMAKLGVIYPSELEKIQKILARVASRNKPFSMSFDSPVSFDKRYVASNRKGTQSVKEQDFPFVLWARPDPRGWTRLSGLFKNMAGTLGRGGFSYGYAPSRYQAHTTIARAKIDQEEAVMRYIDDHRHWKSRDFQIKGFVLREFYPRNHPLSPEQNNGQGSRFRTEKSFILSGS